VADRAAVLGEDDAHRGLLTMDGWLVGAERP
jgi:hypothetical protein